MRHEARPKLTHADVDAVDLNAEEHLQDINDITGALKLWFRELPEPLMTYELYGGFVDAAKIENDRLRHIRLHERVNELPDANYATLKYLMGHLDKVSQNGEINQMRASNLAIVFGPTLFRPPPDDTSSALSDMAWQCKAVRRRIADRLDARRSRRSSTTITRFSCSPRRKSNLSQSSKRPVRVVAMPVMECLCESGT